LISLKGKLTNQAIKIELASHLKSQNQSLSTQKALDYKDDLVQYDHIEIVEQRKHQEQDFIEVNEHCDI
jgi:hypothetical protein